MLNFYRAENSINSNNSKNFKTALKIIPRKCFEKLIFCADFKCLRLLVLTELKQNEKKIENYEIVIGRTFSRFSQLLRKPRR